LWLTLLLRVLPMLLRCNAIVLFCGACCSRRAAIAMGPPNAARCRGIDRNGVVDRLGVRSGGSRVGASSRR
jgi:hypothetical protein